jgi:hypothetical protein
MPSTSTTRFSTVPHPHITPMVPSIDAYGAIHHFFIICRPPLSSGSTYGARMVPSITYGAIHCFSMLPPIRWESEAGRSLSLGGTRHHLVPGITYGAIHCFSMLPPIGGKVKPVGAYHWVAPYVPYVPYVASYVLERNEWGQHLRWRRRRISRFSRGEQNSDVVSSTKLCNTTPHPKYALAISLPPSADVLLLITH